MVRAGVGLGLGTHQKDEGSYAVVTKLVEGGAAFEQGNIAVGDLLLKVDGRAVKTASEAKRHLVGDEGSPVLLTFRKFSKFQDGEVESNRVEEFNTMLIRKPLPQNLPGLAAEQIIARAAPLPPPPPTAAEIASAAVREVEEIGTDQPRRRQTQQRQALRAAGPAVPRGGPAAAGGGGGGGGGTGRWGVPDEDVQEVPTWDKDALWPQTRMARLSITCSVFITLSQLAVGKSAQWFPYLRIPSAAYWPLSGFRYLSGFVPADSLVRSQPLLVGAAVTTLLVSSTSLVYRSGVFSPLERLFARCKSGLKLLSTAALAVAGVSLLQHGREALEDPGLIQGAAGWGLWTLGCTGIFSFVVGVAHAARLKWARNPVQKLYWMFATQACLTAAVIAGARIQPPPAFSFASLVDTLLYEVPKAGVAAAGLVFGFDALGKVWEQDVLKSIAWIPFRVAKKVYKLVKEYSIMVAGAGIAYGGYLIFNGVLSPDLAPESSLFRRLFCCSAGLLVTLFSSCHFLVLERNIGAPPYLPRNPEFCTLYHLAMAYLSSLLPFSPNYLRRGAIALLFMGHGVEMVLVDALRRGHEGPGRAPKWVQPLTIAVNKTLGFIDRYFLEIFNSCLIFGGIEILYWTWTQRTLTLGSLVLPDEATSAPSPPPSSGAWPYVIQLLFVADLLSFASQIVLVLLGPSSLLGPIPGSLLGSVLVLGGCEQIGKRHSLPYLDECLTTPAYALGSSLKRCATALQAAGARLWAWSQPARSAGARVVKAVWRFVQRSAEQARAAAVRFGTWVKDVITRAWRVVVRVSTWLWETAKRVVVLVYEACKKAAKFAIRRWKILLGCSLELGAGALFALSGHDTSPQMLAVYATLCSFGLELIGRELDIPVLRGLLSHPLNTVYRVAVTPLMDLVSRCARAAWAHVTRAARYVWALVWTCLLRPFLERWWKLAPATLTLAASAAFFLAFLSKLFNVGSNQNSSLLVELRDASAPLLACLALLTVGGDLLGSMGSPRAQSMARSIAKKLDLGLIDLACFTLIPHAYRTAIWVSAWVAAKFAQQLPLITVISAAVHGFVAGFWRNTVGVVWRAIAWCVRYIWQRPWISFVLSLSSLYFLYRVHSGTIQVPFQDSIPPWVTVQNFKALPSTAWGGMKAGLSLCYLALARAYAVAAAGAAFVSGAVAKGAIAAEGQVGALKDIVANSEVPLSAVVNSPRVGYVVWCAVMVISKGNRNENSHHLAASVLLLSFCAHFLRHLIVYIGIFLVIYVGTTIAAGWELRRQVERSVRQVRHDAREAARQAAVAEQGAEAPAQLFNSECPVCMDQFQHEEALSAMPCGHCFHPNCLEGWLNRGRRDCPTCRQVPPGDGVAARVARVVY